MVQEQKLAFHLFVPNLISICVDEYVNEEIAGRLYHCHSNDPIYFHNVVELVREAEDFFDRISFPQASTKSRCFTSKEEVIQPKTEQVMNQRELLQYSGKKSTVLLAVRFRQNSTWQGEMYHIECGQLERFNDIVEFLKQVEKTVK